MGSRCLSDSSVICHDLIHVKLFKDLVFFAVLMLMKFSWKLFWILKPYLRALSSVINDVISEFLQSGAPVPRRNWPISSNL